MLALTSPIIRLTLAPVKGKILDLTQMKRKKITQLTIPSTNFWMELAKSVQEEDETIWRWEVPRIYLSKTRPRNNELI